MNLSNFTGLSFSYVSHLINFSLWVLLVCFEGFFFQTNWCCNVCCGIRLSLSWNWWTQFGVKPAFCFDSIVLCFPWVPIDQLIFFFFFACSVCCGIYNHAFLLEVTTMLLFALIWQPWIYNLCKTKFHTFDCSPNDN